MSVKTVNTFGAVALISIVCILEMSHRHTTLVRQARWITGSCGKYEIAEVFGNRYRFGEEDDTQPTDLFAYKGSMVLRLERREGDSRVLFKKEPKWDIVRDRSLEGCASWKVRTGIDLGDPEFLQSKQK
jgi:hypothetical protein